MGIDEIRALKNKEGKGTVLTVAEAREMFKNKKVGTNKMEGQFHSGKYETSKGEVYFRSKWEANYAVYLDWLVKQKQIKDWEYESENYFFEGIKLGNNSYRPDFKVFLNDGKFELHEVKGFMSSDGKVKLKRMAKYFPDVKIALVDKKAYGEIVKRMKGLISFY